MLWGSWDLPEDASMEILSRLPVKFLASCKCISKSWYALITNPSFITKHLKTSRNPHRGGSILMRVHRFKALRLHTLSKDSNETLRMSGVVDPRKLFQYEVAGLSMFGPCNGILCFFATLRKDRHWHNYNRALLWMLNSWLIFSQQMEKQSWNCLVLVNKWRSKVGIVLGCVAPRLFINWYNENFFFFFF
jgi:hypothetical protein